MAAQTQTVDWRGKRCRHRRLAWPCLSLILRLKFHRREEEHGPLKGSAELPVSWLLSGQGELSGFRASICVEAISPTSVDRCGWMRCLLRTAVSE